MLMWSFKPCLYMDAGLASMVSAPDLHRCRAPRARAPAVPPRLVRQACLGRLLHQGHLLRPLHH
jgi:hypothetical protein